MIAFIEVFKTNVRTVRDANRLIDRIHKTFTGYEANFDLDDCDKILRVKSTVRSVQPSPLIELLKDCGFKADVLPDDDQFAGEVLLNDISLYLQKK